MACVRRQNPFPINQAADLRVSGVFLLVSLVSSLVYIPWNGFSSSRRYGYYLWALYLAFMVTSIALQFV